MIRVEREEGENGQFNYLVVGFGIRGKSRMPLFDACRELKRMGCAPAQEIGLFRAGRKVADLSTTVRCGANLTVEESANGNGPRFRRYKEFLLGNKGDL